MLLCFKGLSGRRLPHGEKISWKDGLAALRCLNLRLEIKKVFC